MKNWDKASPQEVTLGDLENAQESDFPETYSGMAWRAAWLMYHQDYKINPTEFLSKDGWSSFPCLDDIAYSLTGFMVGWACNALRYMLNAGPVADGATIIIGSKEQPKGIHIASAADSVKVAIGGKKALEDKG